MFGIGLIEVAIVLGMLVGAGAFVLRAARRVAAAGDEDRSVATAEWRAVLAVRLVAALLGLVLAAIVWNLGANGTGSMLAMAVFGLCVLIGTALGETLIRPPVPEGPRTASMVARRVRDYRPGWTPVVGGQLLVLVALMVVTTLTASDDDRGHARALSCSAAGLTQSHSPYPGSFYTAPLAAMLAVVLVAAALAARRVVQRPRGMAPTDGADDGLRRNSLSVVVAATGVAIGFSLAGLAFTTGASLTSMSTGRPTCAPDWFHPVGVALLLLGLASLGIAANLVGRLLLVRSPRG